MTINKNSLSQSLALTALLAGFAFGATLAGNPAHAASLDFNVSAPTNNGSITFSGVMGESLLGNGIEVDNVVGLGTTDNDGVTLNCLGCILEFETGGYTGSSANQWIFDNGGYVKLTGGIDTNNDAIADFSGDLLTGMFNEASTVQFVAGQLVFNIAAGTFADTKNPELLAFYGLPDVDYMGGMNISFLTATPADPGSGFQSTQILSGDVFNSPVPLPAAAWLFAGGLLGLAAFYRRRTYVGAGLSPANC
jgi:hypothetical protein